MPGHPDNDWPAEVKGLRRIPEQDARHLSHGIPEKDPAKDKSELQRQLADEKQHGHPAAALRDRDED
jgi:hypothetical protein